MPSAPAPVHVHGQGSLLVRGDRLPPQAAPHAEAAPGKQPRVQETRGGACQAGKRFQGNIGFAVHGVGGRDVVDETLCDPGRHVQPHGVALFQGLKDPRAQQQLPVPLPSLVIQHPPDAPQQPGHQALSLRPPARREIVVVPEAQLQSVDVKTIDQLGGRRKEIVPHLLEGEIEGRAQA